MEFRDIVWIDLGLKLQAVHQDYPEHQASIQATIGPENISFQADVPRRALAWQGMLYVDDDKATLENTIVFLENRLSLLAEIGADSWFPERANWNAGSWQIASEELGVDIQYSDFGFDFSGSCRNGEFEATGLALLRLLKIPNCRR